MSSPMLRLLPLALLVVAIPLARADGPKPADGAKHWAFQAPVRPAVPGGSANPIDAFILDRLKQEQLAPSPEADKIALCRRLYLDLIGLPPSPKDVDEYLADKSTNAY